MFDCSRRERLLGTLVTCHVRVGSIQETKWIVHHRSKTERKIDFVTDEEYAKATMSKNIATQVRISEIEMQKCSRLLAPPLIVLTLLPGFADRNATFAHYMNNRFSVKTCVAQCNCCRAGKCSKQIAFPHYVEKRLRF